MSPLDWRPWSGIVGSTIGSMVGLQKTIILIRPAKVWSHRIQSRWISPSFLPGRITA